MLHGSFDDFREVAPPLIDTTIVPGPENLVIERVFGGNLTPPTTEFDLIRVKADYPGPGITAEVEISTLSSSMPSDFSFNSGGAVSGALPAGGLSGVTYTYSASGAPAWLTIDLNTRVISGTAPEVEVDTVFTFMWIITDELGFPESQEISILILADKRVEKVSLLPLVDGVGNLRVEFDLQASIMDDLSARVRFTSEGEEASDWSSITNLNKRVIPNPPAPSISEAPRLQGTLSGQQIPRTLSTHFLYLMPTYDKSSSMKMATK